MNYSTGMPEDSTGVTFFSISKYFGGNCSYRVQIDYEHPDAPLFLSNFEANLFVNNLNKATNKFGLSKQEVKGIYDVFIAGVDLSKGNFESISFYKIHGREKLNFSESVATLKYEVKVEGLPSIFQCDSNKCNIERLRRGWNLVASKCKGVKKAF